MFERQMVELGATAADRAQIVEALRGDLDRQDAVELAQGGCVLVVMGLALVTVVAVLALHSLATPILATLLTLGGLGLGVMEWAERG